MDNVLMFGIGELVIIGITGTLVYRLHDKSDTNRAHETRLLNFAAVILTALALVFMLGMAMYYWSPWGGNSNPGQEIFHTCGQVIPPIITLVIGYFFGRQETKPEAKKEVPSAPLSDTP